MPQQRREWVIYNSGISSAFTTQSTQIQQLSDSLTLQANKVTTIENQVQEDHAQMVITSNGMLSTVSSTVGADTVISTINQTAGNVAIRADKIDLQGYVTFSSLSTPNQTIIDGSNIRTDSVLAGGWRIASDGLTSGVVGEDESVGLYHRDHNANIAGQTRDWRIAVGSHFGVDNTGVLVTSGDVYVGSLITTNTVKRTGAHCDLVRYDHLVHMNIPVQSLMAVSSDITGELGNPALTLPRKYWPVHEVWAPTVWERSNEQDKWKLGTMKVATNGKITFYLYGTYGVANRSTDFIPVQGTNDPNNEQLSGYTVCVNAMWFTNQPNS